MGTSKRELATTQAAKWLLELEGRDLSEERIAAWQRWLSESVQHRQAFDRLQALQECIEGVRNLPWPSEEALASDVYDGSIPVSQFARGLECMRRDSQRHRRLVWTAAFATAAAAAVAAVSLPGVFGMGLPGIFHRTVLDTGVGELRRVQLTDGSTVTIDGDSRVTVDLGKAQRELTLEHGEAFFEVGKDPRRPFIVHAGPTAIRAVGTAFNVRRAGGDVTVAVAEGAVEVERSHPPTVPNGSQELAAPLTERVSAGHQLRLISAQLDAPVPLAIEAVAAWREGRRQYIGEPLVNVVADLSRYSKRKIVIEDRQTGELTISGAVFENNIDQWLKSLAAALPVEVRDESDGTVTIGARSHGTAVPNK